MILSRSGPSRIPSSENSPSSGDAHERGAKSIKIQGQGHIFSVSFLVDGKHIVSSGKEGRIWRWAVEPGNRVQPPMDVGYSVYNIAVSRDGKWVVSGTGGGKVMVWNAASHEKVTEFKGHNTAVRAVDVSPDGTRIVTGSDDSTACVWSLPTGQRLLGPLQHSDWLVAAKFSPDGRRIATATCGGGFIRIYGSQSGELLVDVPIRVRSWLNQSLAWASDSKRLFVLSQYGNINCLDASTGTTLAAWPIHGTNDPKCIALTSNGTFIAASDGSSVSFWDTTTHRQIGSIIKHTADIESMAISANYDIVVGGDKTITLWRIRDILPSPYLDHERSPSSRVTHLEKTIQELRDELARSRRVTDQEKDGLNDIIRLLRADLHTQQTSSTNLEKTIQELRDQLATSQRAINQAKDTLKETTESPRVQEGSLTNKITHLVQTVEELRVQLADSQHKADSLIRIIRAHEQKRQCESLYGQGRIYDTAESLLEIANTTKEDLRANKLVIDWLDGMTHQCVTTLERSGEEASNAEEQDEDYCVIAHSPT